MMERDDDAGTWVSGDGGLTWQLATPSTKFLEAQAAAPEPTPEPDHLQDFLARLVDVKSFDDIKTVATVTLSEKMEAVAVDVIAAEEELR